MKIIKIPLLLLLCVPLASFAAGGFNRDNGNRPYYRGDPQTNTPPSHKNGASSAMPNGSRSDGISSTSTEIALTTNGFERIAGTDIPIGVKSVYTKNAAVAAAVAAAALCGSNPIAAIVCAAAVQYGVEQGITACQQPGGWCNEQTAADMPLRYYSTNSLPGNYYSSSAATCAALPPESGYTISADGGSTGGYCLLTKISDGSVSNFVNWNSAACPLQTTNVPMASACGLTPDNTPWVPSVVPSPAPWLDPGFGPYLGNTPLSDPKWVDYIKSAADAGYFPESTPAAGPTVTAPQTTGAPKTSTTTSTRPDGSVDTTTTTSTPIVTPTVINNNTNNPTVTYNTTNNTSTSVSNSVTGPVSTTTTTETHTESPPLELPDDYNREVTQQQIADELSGKNAPAAPEDQAVRTDTKIAETDTGLADMFTDIGTNFVPDKNNWFSWVWTPPVGTCNDNDFSGTVHGYSVAFSICPWVAKIREALGFLFALFGAMVIYGQIFKREG